MLQTIQSTWYLRFQSYRDCVRKISSISSIEFTETKRDRSADSRMHDSFVPRRMDVAWPLFRGWIGILITMDVVIFGKGKRERKVEDSKEKSTISSTKSEKNSNPSGEF